MGEAWGGRGESEELKTYISKTGKFMSVWEKDASRKEEQVDAAASLNENPPMFQCFN